jgi:hydrophobic/amphiphilic exporter-1 (mainly G- bacteria), HAE1 family
MFLSNLSITRPVFATVMMLSLLTLGIASYRRLAIDLYPNVEIPVITIVTVFPGASPEAVEREVSKRIEEAVNPIAGVRHVGSISREGVSQIFVEFELEVSADRAAEEARTKIAAIRGDLPVGMRDPIIEKLDVGGMPVVSLAVRSTMLSPPDLTALVEKTIKRRLENVSGVGKIDLVGAVTREIAIEIKPDRLDALAIGIDEVMSGLRRENIDTPLGRVSGVASESSIRVQGKARTVDEFRTMIVTRRGGRPIALGEVADVIDGVEEVRSMAFVDGAPAVALDVLKQSGANAVGVADAVRKEAAALAPALPAGTTLEFVRDGSVMIRESVEDVQQTLVIGGLLTILIVFVFLNSWRSTVITGLTLPISVIASFIVMNFAGMTLNVMTLMALSLAIGLLIDDAIVVRENIVRHLERGEDHFEAARQGTGEIGLAVLATTFSIIAVFIPVAFMKGIVGRFFFAFGITVAFAVLVSLFVSFTLDPMLSSRWIDPDIARTGRRNPIARLLDGFNRWFDRTADGYRSVIAWALAHRLAVVGLAFAAFVAGVTAMGLLESEFFPQFDQGEFVASFKTAPDASIDETRGRLEVVTATLREFPEIERQYASIGAGDAGTVRDARVYIKLTARPTGVAQAFRPARRSQHEIERDLRSRLLEIPGIVPWLGQAASFDNRKPLLVNIRGEALDVLKPYSQKLKDALYDVPGVVDLEATLEHEAPEYRLIVDRDRAADVGLDSGAIAGTVGPLVGGQTVTTFEDREGDTHDVRVRLPAALRQDMAAIERLRVAVAGGGVPSAALVPIGSVARYELGTTPSEIGRMDLSRQVVVSGNLDGLPLGTAVASVKRAAGALGLPPGYRVEISGENEAMEESFRYMGEALILAIVFVYLILAAQFESFIDPLSIMLSLPLSIVGMAAMLLLTGDTVNIMSLIGLIMLMGLVTKNAILLVDYSKVLRGRGLDRTRAVVEAGRTRLRPIIMTTSAMVFGMLPLALGLGSGGEMRAPMARAVIGGLITSTLLTLIVVPVVYTLLDDMSAWVGRYTRRSITAAATAVLAIAAVTWPSIVGAQPTSTRTLTLEEALAIAAAQNRDVQKAVEYQNWVRAKYVEERASALPQVTFSGNALRQFDDSQSRLFRNFTGFGDTPSSSVDIREIFGGRQDVRIAEVRITQPLFTWGQVGAAVRAARVGYGFADAQLRRFRQSVAKDVSTAFYDVLAARELAALASEDLAQKQRHHDRAKDRRAIGVATEYDVLAAEVVVKNARPAVIRADNAVRVSREQLRFLLAETATDIDASGTLATAVQPPPPYREMVARALQNRPELAELASQRSIYAELVTIARAADKPRIDFATAIGTRNLALPSLSATGRTWNAAIVATMPIFDGMRARGRTAQAQTDLARVKLDELKLRDAIMLELRLAVNAVQEAGEIVTALAGTVDQAETLLFLAEKGYELGVKTHLDVQDAQLNLLSAKSNLARAQRDYHVARVTLEWAAGTIETGGTP